MANSIKQLAKEILPVRVVRIYQKRRIEKLRSSNSDLSTKEVFTRIYGEKRWSASSGSDFRSGSGSTEELAQGYADFIADFIDQHRIASVVDLGCGDFNIGSRIAATGVSYTGIDIVEDLIAYNQKKFGNELVKFKCLNIIEDDLPVADLCLVRQVFQHLSNDQILTILPKLREYKFVLVTEHQPPWGNDVLPNLDKPHGEDTRLHDNSAVYLDKPPFSLPDIQEVFSADAPPVVSPGETIRTVLMEHRGRSTTSAV